MLSHGNAREDLRQNTLVGVMWNVNGITEMREYIKELVQEVDPDVVLLTETKRKRILDISIDLGCDPRTHRVIQMDATAAHRGGLIMILKNEIRVETVELIRPTSEEDFIQGIVIEDREGNAFIGLYCAPTLATEKFGEVVNRLLTAHKVILLLGDLKARHPTWCRQHDAKKRGLRLIKEVQKTEGHRIHAAQKPSFQAPRNRNRGLFGSSNIDLVVAQIPVQEMVRIEGSIAERSDHFPVRFQAAWNLERGNIPRRIPKTLLQSKQMKESVGATYTDTLKEAAKQMEEILASDPTSKSEAEVQAVFTQAHKAILDPWEKQVKKRRRASGPHVNSELLRLWARKKQYYDRWRWRPTDSNRSRYKDACRVTQRRERQLIKEQQRRAIQRIQCNPQSELAKALQASGRRRQRQLQMERASGKQLRPRDFAEHLADKLDGPQQRLKTQPFTVDEEQFAKDVHTAISKMEANKAIGGDGVHVEMLKTNPAAAARLLTRMWQVVGKTGQVPAEWLKGTIVPLYKGKGEQNVPANSRPLCILSHVRKLIEKAVTTELDRTFETDESQYGFQQGIQVTQAALSVLAALKKGIEFVFVLDLAKAYDNVQKILMEGKLRQEVDDNLTNQLIIFLLTVQAKVTGDISHTMINMLRGLTQGGTSSPALFRVFINSLPVEIRQGMQEAGLLPNDTDPTRLVADDVIGLAHSIEGLQKLLDIYACWAARNGLNWNPTKSQVMRLGPPDTTQDTTVKLNGTVLTLTEEVDYLGLILTREGFKGKDKKELLEKCTGALQMLINEPSFDLSLHPKHIAQAYRTYVRSIMLYGAELLNTADRQTLYELDDKLLNTLLGKLLKLGRNRLSARHRILLQLALGITSLEMDLNDLIRSRIDTWLMRRASRESKVRYHASESIKNILCLQETHPLRKYLLSKATETTTDWLEHKRRGWAKILEECTDAGSNSGSRQLVCSGLGLGTGRGKQEVHIVEDGDLAPELKKTLLRWSVYKFPVRYKLTEQEEQLFADVPRWKDLSLERKTQVRGALLGAYNAEQNKWGMQTIPSAGARDIRSQKNVN